MSSTSKNESSMEVVAPKEMTTHDEVNMNAGRNNPLRYSRIESYRINRILLSDEKLGEIATAYADKKEQIIEAISVLQDDLDFEMLNEEIENHQHFLCLRFGSSVLNTLKKRLDEYLSEYEKRNKAKGIKASTNELDSKQEEDKDFSSVN